MILSVSITTVFADEIISDPNEPLEYSFVIESSGEGDEINPRADIIEWRYKTINGYLYRRKYNYTKHKWIGHWERV
jgi:hypothetical protein